MKIAQIGRFPSNLDSLVVRRLCVGESRVDLLFRRQESSVAVSLLSREGGAEVEVLSEEGDELTIHGDAPGLRLLAERVSAAPHLPGAHRGAASPG